MKVRSSVRRICMQCKIVKRRGVVRTKNNPVGDYAEWLVTTTFGLALAGKSSAGFDATDDDGTTYQIKARRVTPDNPSRQLGARLADRNQEGTGAGRRP